MKELMGGALVAGLGAGALGCWIGAVVLGIIAALAGAAGWVDEMQAEKRAASWRAKYPTYKY